jgi:hypothetical protein
VKPALVTLKPGICWREKLLKEGKAKLSNQYLFIKDKARHSDRPVRKEGRAYIRTRPFISQDGLSMIR